MLSRILTTLGALGYLLWFAPRILRASLPPALIFVTMVGALAAGMALVLATCCCRAGEEARH